MTQFLQQNRLAQEFHPNRLLPTLTTGAVTGTMEVTVAIAFAKLIFSGDLAHSLSNGIGFILFGGIILSSLTALTSSFTGVITTIQDSPAAILALVAIAIMDRMPSGVGERDVFFTVLAAITLASLLTGISFLLLGQFRLGNLIRFIPYPVIGGFLAGTGLLLVQGAISVMTGEPVSVSQLSPLVEPGLIAKWLPGLVFAVVLLGLLRRYHHFLIVPGMLVAGITVFYVALLLTGTSVSEATGHGWLLEVFPKGSETSTLWHPLNPSDIERVDWSVLGGQVANLLAIAVVSTIALLLNATGIEVASERNIDLNHELKAVGVSNLIAGISGGMPGYHALGPTMLAQKMGPPSRLAGVFTAGVCAMVLFAGGSLLSYFPNAILGGLLLLLGLDFLVEWVYDAWFKLPKTDYLIVIAILVVINTLGFLQGVGLGIVLAVVLFVVTYSRIDVVKHTLTGTTYHSNRLRPDSYQELLHQNGTLLYILKLQGSIFFGTAHKLFDQVRERVQHTGQTAPRFVVLDFHLVSGLDSSAVLSFAKIKQLAEQTHFTLVFTDLAPAIRQRLEKELLHAEADPVWRIFPDLDHGVEWCENLILLESTAMSARPQSIKRQIEAMLAECNCAERFIPYLEQVTVDENYTLIHQGDPPVGLYFIESGQVTVQLEMTNTPSVRIRTMDAGTLVGEIGTYLNQAATASVITNQPSTLYRLSLDALRRMETTDPEVASAFHRFMAHFMAERLTHTTETLQALVD